MWALTTVDHTGGLKPMNTIEQVAYISHLQLTQGQLMEKYCGKKYARKKRAFVKRVKTVKRTLLTMCGKITLIVEYIKDKSGKLVSPLLQLLGVKKYQRMPEDLKDKLRDKASKMTYAETAEDAYNSFSININRQIVWRLNQEKKLRITQNNASHKILLADGTKVKHNKTGHLEPQAIMSVDEEKKEKSLLAFEIGVKWEEIANKLDLTNRIVLVGDGEPGLKEPFIKRGLHFHYCQQHAIRDLSFYLWKDQLEKTARSEFMKPLKAILYTTQNSTNKYWKDHDKNRLTLRIQWAKKEINKLAAKAAKRGLTESSRFLSDNNKYFFTAAQLAITHNLQVPWTTNQIERLMKEIGKRTKKRSMRWSEKGLRTILSPILKRYFLPTKKRNYKNIYGGDTNSGSSPNVNHI